MTGVFHYVLPLSGGEPLEGPGRGCWELVPALHAILSSFRRLALPAWEWAPALPALLPGWWVLALLAWESAPALIPQPTAGLHQVRGRTEMLHLMYVSWGSMCMLRQGWSPLDLIKSSCLLDESLSYKNQCSVPENLPTA